MFTNLRHPIIGNLKVRQAITYAIDRQFMIDNINYGWGKVAEGPIPEGHWYFKPDLPYPQERDLDKANQLLDEAGYPRGTDGIRFEITCSFDVGMWDFVKASEATAAQLAEVGIKVNLRGLETPGMYDTIWLEYDYDIFIHHLGIASDFSVEGRIYLSSQIVQIPFTNCMGYNSSVADELFDAVTKEIDSEKRKDIFYEIQDVLVADLPIIWMWEKQIPHAFWEDVVGLPPGPMYQYPLTEVWHTGASTHSPMEAQAVIAAAESEISTYKAQNFDVTAAESKLSEAQTAYEKLGTPGNYDDCYTLATEAKALADDNPPPGPGPGPGPGPEPEPAPFPTELVIGVVAVIVIVAAAALYMSTRKKD
jgi:hypothetical protein